ncbi:MAG: hypothetical protein AMXMBFR74_15100 [Parvibaculum sp.]
MANGDVIDHGAVMDVARALVDTPLPDSPVVVAQIDKILTSIDVKDPWGFYAKAWILSKYGTEKQIIDLLGAEVSLWSSQEHLSRMVAGFYPRVAGTVEQSKFEAILNRSGNAWSQSVLAFHRDLLTTAVGYTAIKDIALAPNTSMPSAISHAKYLTILSLLKNPTISGSHGLIKTKHAKALAVPFYAKWVP